MAKVQLSKGMGFRGLTPGPDWHGDQALCKRQHDTKEENTVSSIARHDQQTNLCATAIIRHSQYNHSTQYNHSYWHYSTSDSIYFGTLQLKASPQAYVPDTGPCSELIASVAYVVGAPRHRCTQPGRAAQKISKSARCHARGSVTFNSPGSFGRLHCTQGHCCCKWLAASQG